MISTCLHEIEQVIGDDTRTTTIFSQLPTSHLTRCAFGKSQVDAVEESMKARAHFVCLVRYERLVRHILSPLRYLVGYVFSFAYWVCSSWMINPCLAHDSDYSESTFIPSLRIRIPPSHLIAHLHFPPWRFIDQDTIQSFAIDITTKNIQ